jgi:hypothetical protein
MAIGVSFAVACSSILEDHHGMYRYRYYGQKIQDSLSRAGQPFGAVSESWLARQTSLRTSSFTLLIL